jgi:hypothetical protein
MDKGGGVRAKNTKTKENRMGMLFFYVIFRGSLPLKIR